MNRIHGSLRLSAYFDGAVNLVVSLVPMSVLNYIRSKLKWTLKRNCHHNKDTSKAAQTFNCLQDLEQQKKELFVIKPSVSVFDQQTSYSGHFQSLPEVYCKVHFSSWSILDLQRFAHVDPHTLLYSSISIKSSYPIFVSRSPSVLYCAPDYAKRQYHDRQIKTVNNTYW